MTQSSNSSTNTPKQQHHIIIAHPPVKQQKGIVDQVSALFKSDNSSNTSQNVQVKRIQEVIPVVKQQEAGQSSNWFKDFFSNQNKQQCKKMWDDKVSQWKDIDVTLSNDITKFKEQHLLSLGDIRIRSILMAFTSAVLYKLVSYNTTGLLRKTRNLGLSFAFMGYWFVPQLFNPFLKKGTLAQNLV